MALCAQQFAMGRGASWALLGMWGNGPNPMASLFFLYQNLHKILLFFFGITDL